MLTTIQFYTPHRNSPFWVKLWYRWFKPRFTHCNLTFDDYVYDLGTGSPTVTELQEARQIRPRPVKYITMSLDLGHEDMWTLADLKAHNLRSAFRVLGIKWFRPVNCASFVSAIIQLDNPLFPTCYTPDELESAIERQQKAYPRLYQATTRVARRQGG